MWFHNSHPRIWNCICELYLCYSLDLLENIICLYSLLSLRVLKSHFVKESMTPCFGAKGGKQTLSGSRRWAPGIRDVCCGTLWLLHRRSLTTDKRVSDCEVFQTPWGMKRGAGVEWSGAKTLYSQVRFSHKTVRKVSQRKLLIWLRNMLFSLFWNAKQRGFCRETFWYCFTSFYTHRPHTPALNYWSLAPPAASLPMDTNNY